jgi:hypothetical protein
MKLITLDYLANEVWPYKHALYSVNGVRIYPFKKFVHLVDHFKSNGWRVI